MRFLAIAVSWLGWVAAPSPTPIPEPRTAFAWAALGNQAYQAGDMPGFLRNYEEAARRRPGDVRILYNLACAQARNGQARAAVATLRDIAAHRVADDVAADTDFDAIRGEDGYKEVVESMATLRKQRITGGAVVAFTIREKELAPEGVAFDPVSKAFFVASVRKGKIVRVGPDGTISDFVPAGRGLKSALGIGVDARRRTLWVANATIPLMNGAKEGDPPDSALFEFDLDSGRLRKKHLPPASSKAPQFDDLTVAADGHVYVNDGQGPRIYDLVPERGELRLWLESDAIGRGTQGLAATPDGRALYLSDYRGLYRIPTATKQVTPLPVPADTALNGVDGLIFFEDSLIAIQNGIVPHRVIRLDLAPDGIGITRARILEMNHPAFDEPTLGTVVDGTLYFTANNQGHRYYDTKHPFKPEDLQDAVILRLPLKPAP